ncbi:MAG: hypothetical protein ABH865_07475 [Candidatus Omnitrophota bacterium]
MKKLIAVAILALLASTVKAAIYNQEITETAKVTFSLNKEGTLQALVIKHIEEGSYPKSGWVNCAVQNAEIEKKYVAQLKGKAQIEDYFTVTYIITEQNKQSQILSYEGIVLQLEPWSPVFLHKGSAEQ